MIEAHGLVKRYGSAMAVNDLSFSVRPGLVTGFLGPNGAGKTTTMRMILGLDAPTQGSVTVGGRSYRDLPAPMREVGALLDARALHGGRRAFDHLLCLAHSNGVPRSRVEEVLRSPRAADLAARCREAGATVRAGGTSRAAAAPVADPDAGTGPDVIEITGMDSAEVGWLAAAHGIVLSELIPVRGSLEEAFMELTRDSVEYQAAGATR